MAQSQPGGFGQKYFLPIQGIEPWIVQTVAKLLFRLRYLGDWDSVDDRVFAPQQRQDIFLLIEWSRPAMGPTHYCP